jgi:GNAT superfamily N-acetyltransferase
MVLFRKADTTDIPELIRLRILFLNEVNNQNEPPEGYEEALARYFRAGLSDGSIAAWVAEEDGAIIATSGICFYCITPGYSNPTGKVAYIQNMFTLPQYRGKGLATELFGRLLEEARARGSKRCSLHATEAGKWVYQKFGFAATEGEMSLDLK